jgi:hypothetical protein
MVLVIWWLLMKLSKWALMMILVSKRDDTYLKLLV